MVAELVVIAVAVTALYTRGVGAVPGVVNEKSGDFAVTPVAFVDTAW